MAQMTQMGGDRKESTHIRKLPTDGLTWGCGRGGASVFPYLRHLRHLRIDAVSLAPRQSAIRIPHSAIDCRPRHGTIRPVDVSGADAVLEVTHPAVGGGQLNVSKHGVHAARVSYSNTGSVARLRVCTFSSCPDLPRPGRTSISGMADRGREWACQTLPARYTAEGEYA